MTPSLQGELDQMHHRLGEVDALHQRVAELEERLDFAERLLARGETPGDAATGHATVTVPRPADPVPPEPGRPHDPVAGSLSDPARRSLITLAVHGARCSLILWPLIRALARRARRRSRRRA